MAVVVGLQDSHVHWYGLELGSGPLTPLDHPAFGGTKTGTGAPTRRTCGFWLLGGSGGGGGRRSA